MGQAEGPIAFMARGKSPLHARTLILPSVHIEGRSRQLLGAIDLAVVATSMFLQTVTVGAIKFPVRSITASVR